MSTLWIVILITNLSHGLSVYIRILQKEHVDRTTPRFEYLYEGLIYATLEICNKGLEHRRELLEFKFSLLLNSLTATISVVID